MWSKYCIFIIILLIYPLAYADDSIVINQDDDTSLLGQQQLQTAVKNNRQFPQTAIKEPFETIANNQRLTIQPGTVSYDGTMFSADGIEFGNTQATDIEKLNIRQKSFSTGRAKSIKICGVEFRNIKRSRFELDAYGCVKRAEITSSKKTDYLIPNPLWDVFLQNKKSMANQNSVWVDSDDDGLSDYVENARGYDASVADIDDDMLSDYEEFLLTCTDLKNPGSLNKGMIDSEAVSYILDNNITEISGVAVDGFLDSDLDGVSDYCEVKLGLDKNNPDSDSDGLSDGEEMAKYGTSPLDADHDNDGTIDGNDLYPLVNFKTGIHHEKVYDDEFVSVATTGKDSFVLELSDSVGFSTVDNVSFSLGSADLAMMTVEPLIADVAGVGGADDGMEIDLTRDGSYEMKVSSAEIDFFDELIEVNDSAKLVFSPENNIRCIDFSAPGRYSYLGNDAFALYVPDDAEQFYFCIRKDVDESIVDRPDRSTCTQCGFFDFVMDQIWINGVVEFL